MHRTRFFAITLASISALLAACGGGGGTGGPPPTISPPPPTSTPTPRPTATPTPESFGCPGVAPFAASERRAMAAPRPIGSGDRFSYTGSLGETYLQSAPCPQPTATTTASVSAVVSDAATTAPNGQSATASSATETDAYPTHTSTDSTTQVLQIGGSKLLLLSTSSNDGTGNSMTTTYANAQEIDDLGTGGTWTNDPAATISEALSDGTAISRTLASNGTYTDLETFAAGNTSTIAVNADGSGTYDFDAGLKCNGEVNFAYAVPSGGNIVLTITTYASKNGVCQTATKKRTFPAWFTVPAAGYVSDTFADNGTQAFPASCSAVPASIGTSGTQVVETYTVLDPVLGYTETRTTTSYDVAGYGPACVLIADTLKSYYDYSDDTTRIDYQSENGQPNSVDTIDETLTIQTAACGTGSAPCAQSRQKQRVKAVSTSAVRGRIASIEHRRALARAGRIEALHAFAMHIARQGAVR